MKRALVVLPLLLVLSCSDSKDTTAPPSPTPSPTPSVTAEPSPTASATPTATAAPVAVGPVGTKVPAGFMPSSATFISDTVGWVLGDSPCPAGTARCDVIARTRDGGRTWRAIPSPKTSPDTLAQIRFADPLNGFVTGERLWATHDGGATWKPVPGVADVNGIAAAAGRVWVNRGGVLQSSPVGSVAFVAEKGPPSVNTIALRGATAVVGSEADSRLYSGAHGAAFTAQKTPCDAESRAIPGLGASHWLLVCAGDAGLGHEEKQAYRSTDGGTTWKALPDPPALSGSDVYVTTDGDFVVDHQQISVYRDGAWKTALDTGGGINEGGFESARLGYCIGGFGDSQDATMKVSHDAGRSWQAVRF